MKRISLMIVVLSALVIAAPAGAIKAQPPAVTVQGDSLTVGIQPYITFPVESFSAEVGRHLSTGLELLKSQTKGAVIVFALGTNDYGDSVSYLESEYVQAMNIAGSRRCVVIPTVYAYSFDNNNANVALIWLRHRYTHKRLQLVLWAQAVRNGKVTLADGVHPGTSASWKYREQLVNKGVTACTKALGL